MKKVRRAGKFTPQLRARFEAGGNQEYQGHRIKKNDLLGVYEVTGPLGHGDFMTISEAKTAIDMNLKKNPRKRLDPYGATLRHIGKHNLRTHTVADHIVAVKVKKGWQKVGGFRSEQFAMDYARASAQAYPRRKFAYFKPGEALKENPAPRSEVGARLERQIQEAATRYEQFTGHEAKSGKRVNLPRDTVALAIGPLLGVAYATIRDGKREKYFHEFSPKAQPLLAVSHDGRRLYLLRGAYRFTDRGIVDKR